MATARTISDARGPFKNARLLDIGSNKGVQVGNPVVNEHGLVGRIFGVTGGVSRMVLLTDVASRTPVLIDRTDARAILTGDGSGSGAQWLGPHIVYVQHPSDPVVWWSPRLMFNSPEWLRETRDNTPMAQMSWAPFVTFWQVSADMLVSNEVPGGYGHRYFGAEMVPAWAKVLDVDPGSREDAIIDAVGRR